MPWKVSYVMNERMKFVVRLEQGERMTDLCREFGISRKTGYKFWGRYREYGPLGLFNESRRPQRIARQTSEQISQLIIKGKKGHPTWGAKKIKAILERRHEGIVLPTVSTVHRILERNDLVKKMRKRSKVSNFLQKPYTKSYAPNDVWSADFKGQFRLGDGKYCFPLTISDHYSRYLVSCEGLEGTSWQAAQGVFELAFRQNGLPKVIRTDNGVPFASRGLAGLTRLSLWWFKLGIEIERIEPGHPEQNGRHERMHLTLKQETTRPAASNLLQQQERFDSFIDEYNRKRPHEALDMCFPSDVYITSSRPYPNKIPDLQYPLHDIVKTVSSGGQVYLYGKNKPFFIGSVFEGEKVGLRELDDGKWLVTFDDMDLGYADPKTGFFESIV